MSDANMSESQIQTAMKYDEVLRDLADADEPWRLKDIESAEYDQSVHRKLAHRGLITIQHRDRTWGHKWSLTQSARAWIDQREAHDGRERKMTDNDSNNDTDNNDEFDLPAPDEDVIFSSVSSGISGGPVYHHVDGDGEIACKHAPEDPNTFIHSREYAEETAGKRPCKECFVDAEANVPDFSAYNATKNTDADEVFGDD